jgi:hypothetical protein
VRRQARSKNGRTALRAEVIRSPLAVAGAIRDRLRAVDGKLPRRRFALDRHLLPWKTRLYGERATRPQLAVFAVAQGSPLWVGALAHDLNW